MDQSSFVLPGQVSYQFTNLEGTDGVIGLGEARTRIWVTVNAASETSSDGAATPSYVKGRVKCEAEGCILFGRKK